MKGKHLTKRIGAMALCLTMTLLVASGCGDGAQSSQSSQSSSSGDASPAVSTTDSGEKPTLKYLMSSMKSDPNENYVAQKMEEITGYKVIYEMLPAENSEDALNLKLASGSDYDIISVGAGITMRALMDTLANQGALTPLDDLIAQYGPNIEKNVSSICWDMTEVDGKRYSIGVLDPTAIPEGNMWCPFIVRTDLAEKMGMDFPDTLDGFTDFLKAVKEQDPAGKGDQNIPLTLSPDSDLSAIKGAFDIYFNWNDVDGKLVPNVKDPRYKEYLTYMNMLYTEGLIDIEYPTNLGDTVKEKFTSGKSAVTLWPLYEYGTVTDALSSAVPEAKIDVFLPLKDSSGTQAMSTSCGLNRLTVIPASSEHKEDAMKYMNLKCDSDNFKISVIGEEGVHYNTVGENQFEPIQPAFGEQLNDANNFICAADDANYGIYWREVRLKKDIRNYDAVKKTAIDHADIARVDPLQISPLLSSYAKYAPSLSQLQKDFEVTVISGAVSMDELDAFADKYMSEGGSEIEAEVNEWWSGYRDTYRQEFGTLK